MCKSVQPLIIEQLLRSKMQFKQLVIKVLVSFSFLFVVVVVSKADVSQVLRRYLDVILQI